MMVFLNAKLFVNSQENGMEQIVVYIHVIPLNVLISDGYLDIVHYSTTIIYIYTISV